MSLHRSTTSAFIATVLATLATLAAGPSQAADPPSVPSDNGSLTGDHIKLATNVNGFIALPVVAGATATATEHCATVGSSAAVSQEANGFVYLRFLKVADKSDTLTFQSDYPAMEACKEPQRVNTYTQYRIDSAALGLYDFKRSGVAFGALVVPFKYRLGGAKELVSSSAMAPYMGIRTAWLQSWGLTFTPVVAAGLSLVPVVDATSKTTTAKAAYTMAVGVRLTSTKNDKFSAGLVYGHDFLNKTDRDADPNVSKPWLSFYLGYAL